jgi:hypothetical protein
LLRRWNKLAEAARFNFGINFDSTDLGLSELNANERGRLDRDCNSAGRVTSVDAACNAGRNRTLLNATVRNGVRN